MPKLLNHYFPKYSRPPSPIKKLIDKFNEIPEDDDIQRLFYIQKISQVLNKNFGPQVYNFVNERPDVAGSWESLLYSYNITPDASFFLKGIHFAKAVSSKAEEVDEIAEDDIYALMQERDRLLEDEANFTANRKRFVSICARMHVLATTQNHIVSMVSKYEHILALTKLKISAVKGQTKETSTAYKTEPLNKNHVNNYNYKLSVKGLPDPLVVRIEDRHELDIEEKLHSHKVSRYFGGEVGAFWGEVLNADGGSIEYHPFALGQFANQGDLRHVAKSLRDESSAKIASTTKHYFSHLNDFFLELKKAGAYHPDIKLSNFLVHNNSLLVSDRKTFIDEATPLATSIRSTPHYAPPQYTDCLNENHDGYLPIARKTRFDMDQFMAYQVGMALKEFLILTQMNELPEEYWESDCNVAAYFKKQDNQITNLSLIIGEMTRLEEGQRLSIQDFQQLMKYLVQKPETFAKHLESKLPASKLGSEIEQELEEIKKLLADKTLTGTELLKRANPLFQSVSERDTPESRLTWYTRILAEKTLKESSHSYFAQLAEKIDQELFENDWERAPWYRKAIHKITFGAIRVSRLTDICEIKLKLDLQAPEFQIHIPQLEFLSPSALDKFGHLKEFFVAHLGPDIEKELDEIKKLLNNKKLTGAELLKQANPIFEALSDTLEPRLVWYAEKLASKTLQKSSHDYFVQLAKKIDRALLESDWTKAPWYSKLVHVLSFSAIRVAHLTKVSEIKVELDFQSPEFQTHMPQLEFLPPSGLDNINPNLKEFLEAHLDEIRSTNASISGSTSSSVNPKSLTNSKTLTPGATPPSGTVDTDPDSTTPSGSVVFKKDANPGEKPPFDGIDFHSENDKDTDDDSSSPSGSVVFKKDANPGEKPPFDGIDFHSENDKDTDDDSSSPSGSVVFKKDANPGAKPPFEGIVFETTVKAGSTDDTKDNSDDDAEGEYDSIVIKDDETDPSKKTTGTQEIPRTESVYTFFATAKKDIPQTEEKQTTVNKMPAAYRRSLHRADSLLRRGEVLGLFATPKFTKHQEKPATPAPETLNQ